MKRLLVLSTVMMALVLVGWGCGGKGSQLPSGEQQDKSAGQEAADSAGETTRLAPDNANATQNPGEVLARFGPEDNPVEITRAELDEELSKMMSRNMQGREAPSPDELPDEVKANMLRNLVDSKLLETLVEGAEIEVSDDAVEAELAKLRKQVEQQGAQLEQALAAQGMSMEDLKSQMKDSLAIQKFVEQQTNGIEVTDAEVKDLYEKSKEQGRFDRPDTVDVAHILVQVDEDAGEEAWAEAKKEIDKAAERLKNGEDFATVAKEVSEDPGSKDRGGTYEGVRKGQMVPEFDKLAFETAVGDVTEPFKTKFGWHILTVNAKTPAGTTPFEEVADSLRNSKIQEKKREALTALLDKAREEMNVQVLADFAQEPEAPAETGQETSEEAAQAPAESQTEAPAPEAAEKAPDTAATPKQPTAEGS